MFDEASHFSFDQRPAPPRKPPKKAPESDPPLTPHEQVLALAASLRAYFPQPCAPTISRAWTFFDVLLIFAGAVVMLVLPGARYVHLAQSMFNADDRPTLDWVVTMVTGVAVYITLYATAITLGRLRKRTLADFGYRKPTLTWLGVAAAAGVVFIPIRMALVFMVAIFIDRSIIENNSTQEMLKNAEFSPVGVIAAGLLVTVLAPLVEELFFRGILYAWLRNRFGVVTGVIVSGLFFGIAHGEPAMIIANSVLGFVLALSYEHSKSLYVPMMIHFVNNFVVASLLALGLIAMWLS